MSARIHTRPEVRPPRAWTFPVPEEHDLPNGLRLLVVDLPGQHVLSLRVLLRLPVSTEPRGQEGVTLLMARCLDEGTEEHDSEELATILERHGIAWGAGAGERGVHLGAEVTSRDLELTLRLTAEMLSRPTFPEVEVTRLRRHRLTDIAHEDANPGARAAKEFVRTYYLPEDRASRPLGGLPDSVNGLSAEMVRARHAQLRAEGGVVVLTGDLGASDGVVQLVADTLGRWQPASGSGVPAEPGPARRAPDADRTVIVSRPGLAQTDLHLGRPGPDRRTPHGWGTYQALGMLLGGAPHSRIDRVLREERGYTYGLRLGFRPRSRGGTTVVGGAVRADASVPALEELLAILDTRGREFDEREVRAAADYVARTAPGRYATADVVADEILSMVSDGLAADTVTATLAELRAVGPDQVAAAWDEVRRGPGWTICLVGDPHQLAGLSQHVVGEPTIID
ncbi:M16 family metallopeptidase [Ornithinimicrobium sp. Y1694]|uniref:M16 family metallopeptidase n=1 Tax=Ornithinimicrobium sp. Y1694 TaxID=3418590 RepID=UPI003CF5CBDE